MSKNDIIKQNNLYITLSSKRLYLLEFVLESHPEEEEPIGDDDEISF